MTEKYTCLDGRAIARDGVRFVSLQANKDTTTGSANFAYWEADQFAQFIPLAIEALREIESNTGEPERKVLIARNALRMLEYKL